MAEVETSLPAAAAVSSTVSQQPGADKDALITRLDTLLEQYLHNLDQYEKLTQQLSKQLSSGYFSLAQANFHNRSGVHYGQDSYDERVQATTKIVVTEDEESRVSFAVESKSPSVGTGTAKDHQSTATQEGEKHQSEADEETKAETDTPSTTTAGERHAASESDPDPINRNSDAEEKASSPQPKVVDPIRMFGILVPPALRSAQASFREAVEGPLIRLAEVTGELRALEREIGRTRKSIRKA